MVMLASQLLSNSPSVRGGEYSAEPPPPQEATDGLTEQVEGAMMQAIVERRLPNQIDGGVALTIDDVRFSQDKLWATAWILYYDTGLAIFLPTEPGLAIAQWDGSVWRVTLTGETGWDQAVSLLPEDLLSQDEKEMWLAMNLGEQVESNPETGYELPWHGGLTGFLSRSVSHDDDFTTAHYSFDFFFPGTTICPSGGEGGAGGEGLNFDIYAAKAGTVWTFDDSVTDCDHSAVNFLVLRNLDDPSIFQLYLHLAQDSIPDGLKVIGTSVAQGQFLARADNTGASTGSHLHFQIEGQPYWPTANPYWAVAKDVVFDEVNIYGGHPRREWEHDDEYCEDTDDDYLCNEYGRATYESVNYPSGDMQPPTGGLAGVTTGQVIESRWVSLNGWASDSGTGVDYLQLMAFYENAWREVGSELGTPFTYNWDLCDVGALIPDGAVSVALNIFDKAGNAALWVGLSHFTKNYTCPSPPSVCWPDVNQVTLFEDTEFWGGCVQFNIGDYPNGNALDPIGNDDASSILVGNNVLVTLYSEPDFNGHSETFYSNDNTLLGNLISSDSLSSMRVTTRSTLPAAPVPVYPAGGSAFREGDVIGMSWQNGGGALEYEVQVTTPTTTITLPWSALPYATLAELSQGAYSWKVRGRNMSGNGAWSAPVDFSIGTPVTLPTVQEAPYVDSMDSTGALWADTGLWTLEPNSGVGGSDAWWYQDIDGDYANGAPNAGWLTSPPIHIPGDGYYLRFFYKYETETAGIWWDQRWVQLSVNGGAFHNFHQLSEDPQLSETSSWLQSPALDLAAYNGDTIQLRFAFLTMDAVLNGFDGWGIDDFSITTQPPAACTDLRQDDTPAQAYYLPYDVSLTTAGEICPNGDWDYYWFNGAAGQRIAVDINAQTEGSLLDPYIILYAGDGTTMLAENDDEIYAVRRDSLLGYTLPQDGIYYIKVRAWKHPAVGGQDYSYTIRLYADSSDPQIIMDWPLDGSIIPDHIFNVSPSISDVFQGVHRVEFYWHNQDWSYGSWDLVSTDWDGTDGWRAEYDPGVEPQGQGAAVYVMAYDLAGNSHGIGAWNLIIDTTPPVSALLPLDPTQTSNAFLLQWTAEDDISWIDYSEIQENLNEGGWTETWVVEGAYTTLWVIGESENTFAYRMHAIDIAGNSEDYPTIAEATTSIPAAEVLCGSLDEFDEGGDDNSYLYANIIGLDGIPQRHNFCNPIDIDFEYDQDWITFQAQIGEVYFIQASPVAPQSAVILRLLAADGGTLLDEFVPDRFGDSSLLVWVSDRIGTVYLQMKHLDGTVIGSAVGYDVRLRAGYEIYLPTIQK